MPEYRHYLRDAIAEEKASGETPNPERPYAGVYSVGNRSWLLPWQSLTSPTALYTHTGARTERIVAGEFTLTAVWAFMPGV
jgi:hypothetical protein